MSGILIREEEFGIDKMVEDIEASYQHSCKHNETNAQDLTYLRQYMFVLIAILKKEIEGLRKS